jgi:hypothetical protein
MSYAAYVLAPERPIPEQRDPRWRAAVVGWLAVTTRVWFELWGALPEDERARAPRFLDGVSISSDAADATAVRDPQIVASATAWTEAAFRLWDEGGRVALPAADAAAFAQATGVASCISLPDLVDRREGWRRLSPKASPDGRVAFLRRDAALDAFPFFDTQSVDRAIVDEIVRGHGGEALVLFTFGHAVHVLLARATLGGARPAWRSFSFRLLRPAAGRAETLPRLREALVGSAIAVDFPAIERALEARSISLRAFFAAFGVPDVEELVPVDADVRWSDFESLARALFAGQKADAKLRKRVNEPFGERGDDDKLPATAKLGKGTFARVYAGCAWSMRQSFALAEDAPAAARHRAVRRYWDLVDGEAGDRLTVGVDKKRVGEAASLARLLAAFPAGLARDPLFLAELALECEAANGHAHVEGLAQLAETIAQVGVVAVAVDGTRAEALRKALGIEGGESVEGASAAPSGRWHGEAILTASFVKGDPAALARAFAAKAKCDAVIASIAPDGALALETIRGGAPGALDLVVDRAALVAAGLRLDVRAIFPALGVGDLLDPGGFDEGARAGGGVRGSAWQRQLGEKAVAALARPADERAIASAAAIVEHLPSQLRGEARACVAISVTLAEGDPETARLLCVDLGLAEIGSANVPRWIEGATVRGCLAASVGVSTLAAVLADLPHGRLALGGASSHAFRW